MKKTLPLLVAVILVIGCSVPSFAGNPYASANIGLVWYEDETATQAEGDEDATVSFEFDSGITLTGALGYDFGTTRLEAELGYQTNDVSTLKWEDPNYYCDGDGCGESDKAGATGNVSLTTFMFNGYYDIKPMDDSNVEIFFTAGIGAAFVHFDEVGPGWESGDLVKDYTSTFSETTWAYQLGAGVAIPVSDEIMIDARYRYFDSADITSRDDDELTDDDPMNISFDSHSALVGLRYNF
ncbi:outer membrane beta-barrel protein [Prosthecochloris sp. SCSIO W1102]|uniref:outer membrane protein n=1 Tax=Prosthecochloris sp. SCSIO W1102 TaxID=2992243 RepID=UPI00223D7EB5|nr:outer membrane beta-barrel protein [Prosthecochloris sp. SCSIO W1102]UZJ39069.1 outer membrane beta-barrel protein [Prosthecochloris sp. SCSIO W1102]